VLDDTRREVRRAGAARVLSDGPVYLDSVVVDVTATPTYRLKAVKQYHELREESPFLPFLVTVAGAGATYYLYDYACGDAPREETPSGATRIQCKASTGLTVGIIASGLVTLGGVARMGRALRDPEPTGSLIDGERTTLTQNGKPRPAARVAIRVTHRGQSARDRTDARGRVVLDLAEAFGIERVPAGSSVRVHLTSPDLDLAHALTLPGPLTTREPLTAPPSVPSLRRLPASVRARAQPYVRSVNEQARLRRIEPALVLAMMQTESNFNPRARSYASAMGLMQLVPTSGGREAYRFVYGRDRNPTSRELYDPDTNIALGVGYLHLLMYRHFGAVRDPKSRLYCTIAGYHTGPGNVARAFVGRRDVGAAVARINRMAPAEVKRQLLRRLPYRSTRKYLGTVLSRMALYTP
jgi:hypothetical protein